MTNNQIQYQRHLEDRRSNLAREALTRRDLSERERHNLVSENYSWADLGERTRHNKAGEQFSWADLTERARHNRIGEQFSWADLAERGQYHTQSLGVERDRLAELHRSNFANEIAKYLGIGGGLGVFMHPQFSEYTGYLGTELQDLSNELGTYPIGSYPLIQSTEDIYNQLIEEGNWEDALDLLYGQ